MPGNYQRKSILSGGVLLFILTSCSGIIYDIPGQGTQSAASASGYCSGEKLSTTSFAAGSGTSNDPWMICNAEQLALVSSTVALSDDYYELAADIDLASVANWTSLGAGASFEGSFDGGTHTISNLTTISGTAAGFFYTLGAAARVTNLTIRQAILAAQ